MNVERLHNVLLQVNEDSKQINLLEKLNIVEAHLKALVSQPQQAPSQQKLSDSLSDLHDSLRRKLPAARHPHPLV